MTDASPRLEVLLNEKSATVTERQQLLGSIKQAFAFLGVVIGALFERGFSASGTEAAFVAIPFIVLAGVAYMYSNTLTLLMLTAHLERLDHILAAGLLGDTALWHADVAAPMARWGIVVKRGRGRVMNPYHALSMTVGTIGLGAAITGGVRG